MKIAVVEDSAKDAETLGLFLERYAKERGLAIEIKRFGDGLDFLEKYNAGYDVVFMDIDLPMTDGMSTAKRLRERDDVVSLVFVTNLQHYAIEGYSVNAVSYLLKPVTYLQCKTLMDKLSRKIESEAKHKFTIRTGAASYCLSQNEVIYVGVAGDHRLEYHLNNGRAAVSVSGSLKNAEKDFSPEQFCKCNSGCLVNLNFVKSVQDGVVDVGVAKLVLSRPQKKNFMKALTAWIGY